MTWDGNDLPMSEWRTLKNIVNLLQPFAKFTSLLSGEDFTTLSCVIPAIMDMNIDLEEVCSVYMCTYVYALVCVPDYMHVIVCMCVCVCVCVCACVYMCVQIITCKVRTLPYCIPTDEEK